jgi:hypothetical protein
VAGRVDAVVTGDKQMLKLGSYGDFRIITLRDFLGFSDSLGLGWAARTLALKPANASADTSTNWHACVSAWLRAGCILIFAA